MPENEIQEAVEKSLTETASQEETTATDTKTEDTKVEDKKEEEVVDKRTLQALQLFDALEDPTKAPAVVKHLMTQLGISVPETKAEHKETKNTIKDLIKDELGADYAFLSDKLGTAIEKALQVQEQKLLEVEQTKQVQSAAKEYETFITENKVTDAEAGELMKLADEMAWTGKGSLTSYLNRLLKQHRNEVSEQKAEIAKRQKQQENYEKRPKTLGIEANEDRVVRGSQTISIKEAVEAALRGEKLD